MSPGTWIDHMTAYKTPWDKISQEEQKSYNPFINNLWLSMNPDFIEIVNEVQKFQVPNRDHYNLYCKILPKKKPYFRWIKARKKVYSKDVVKLLASFYNVGTKEIYDSLCVLSKEKIINILKQMSYNDKQIKTLLK